MFVGIIDEIGQDVEKKITIPGATIVYDPDMDVLPRDRIEQVRDVKDRSIALLVTKVLPKGRRKPKPAMAEDVDV